MLCPNKNTAVDMIMFSIIPSAKNNHNNLENKNNVYINVCIYIYMYFTLYHIISYYIILY